ncbi:MAG: precorrin-8X methylmutase [Actinobacteria bacterium]|nr:MAG: precorrin-8X methylmutase [Actinomycetota bacterium]
MPPDLGAPHPIEAESYRLLQQRVDLSHLGPGARAVVARVIHASADPDYADTMVVDEASVGAGVAAVRAGGPVLTDVEMLQRGITGIDTICCLDEVASVSVTGPTRSARAIALAARRHPTGALVAVGCAPTALLEVLRMAAEEDFAPALVVALPVGFVGAADAKAAARESALPTISNVGEKGGSAVTAAAVNAIVRLAQALPGTGDGRG